MLSVTSNDGADALIGAFRDDNYQPYFMLTNLRHGAGMTESEAMGSFKIIFDDTVNAIYRLNRTTGQIDVIPLVNHSLIEHELGGGSGDLCNYTGDFLHPCDYNANGTFDAADYTVWRNHLGQSGINLVANGNHDGAVNQLDYNCWKARFGDMITVNGGSSAVPEPGDWLLCTAALVCAATTRRWSAS